MTRSVDSLFLVIRMTLIEHLSFFEKKRKFRGECSLSIEGCVSISVHDAKYNEILK